MAVAADTGPMPGWSSRPGARSETISVNACSLLRSSRRRSRTAWASRRISVRSTAAARSPCGSAGRAMMAASLVRVNLPRAACRSVSSPDSSSACSRLVCCVCSRTSSSRLASRSAAPPGRHQPAVPQAGRRAAPGRGAPRGGRRSGRTCRAAARPVWAARPQRRADQPRRSLEPGRCRSCGCPRPPRSAAIRVGGRDPAEQLGETGVGVRHGQLGKCPDTAGRRAARCGCRDGCRCRRRHRQHLPACHWAFSLQWLRFHGRHRPGRSHQQAYL